MIEAFAADRSHPRVRVGRKVESRRRFVVNLTILLHVLYFLEGPFRKWMFPEYATLGVFLRDPLAIFLYAYCFTYRLWRPIRPLRPWVLLIGATCVLGAIPLFLSGYSIVVWLLGCRAYWLYTPLAFIIARNFKTADVMNLIRFNLIVCVPYALLVAVQYKAPVNDFVNKGISGDATDAVVLFTGTVRPFGLFTYTAANVLFAAMSVAFLFVFVMSRQRRQFRTLLYMGFGIAVGIVAVLTGSRTILFLVVPIVLAVLSPLLYTRVDLMTVTKQMMLLLLVAASMGLLVYQFGDMFAAMSLRFDQASELEGSIFLRAFKNVFGFVETAITGPVFGHGIGLGVPGLSSLTGLPHLVYGEEDTVRNINELGPVLGGLLIVCRIGLAFRLVADAAKMAVQGDLTMLPLAAFAAVLLCAGQITNSPIGGYVVWLVVGLAFAMRGTRAS